VAGAHAGFQVFGGRRLLFQRQQAGIELGDLAFRLETEQVQHGHLAEVGRTHVMLRLST
jgi:hypothetical protein